MRRFQIESILERSSCTLEMPLKFHALRRARGCISVCSYNHVSTGDRVGEVVLLTTLCGTPCFNESRSASMRSTEGPAQREISQLV